MTNAKNFQPITSLLIGLPTQVVIYNKAVTFIANTKTLANGTVIKAPIVNAILATEGFVITQKPQGKSTTNFEYIDGKSQDTVWQMVKYTIK